MRVPRWARSPAAPTALVRWSLGVGAMVAVLVGGVRGTQDAVANGDTRTLSLYHQHTQESATITFKRDGRYDREGLEQLNWLLRDWRVEQKTKMEPRLFDVVWELYRSVGANEPIRVISAYRSPQTNAMLRARSRRVSEYSQHMLGKAMDMRLTDVPVDRLRAAAMKLQHGGVGYYAGSFVHVDVGSVRAWPRMTRDQLVRLFPDGKTVHLPADGKPLPGYEQARAELLARGDTVMGQTEVASSEGPGTTLWAALFGRKDEDERDFEAGQAPGPSTTPPARSRPAAGLASAELPARNALAFAAPETTSALDPGLKPAKARLGSADLVAGTARTEQAPDGPGANPLPPRRPSDLVAYTAIAAAPVPPQRPVALVAAADPGLIPASIRLPSPTPPISAPGKSNEERQAAGDAGHVRALFAAAAIASRPNLNQAGAGSAEPPEAIPSGMVAAPQSGLNLHFASRPASALSSTRFAGRAVVSLASLR